MLTIRTMTADASYASRHLSNNDYYARGESITGQWMGRGAAMLGLSGDVAIEQFDHICQGRDPASGEFIRQRQSAERNLYDCVISAPKALSVQALEDPRLIEVHRMAATEAATEMETLAGTRVRMGGANYDRVTGNLVIARFDHDASRELDPNLHVHLVTGNLTYDSVEARWKALQAGDMHNHSDYVTEVYRNAAARGVAVSGYQTVDRLEHGKDLGFGIAGIEESTLEKYSQRSEQKQAAIDNFIAEHGRKPSNNEIARLVRETRGKKLTEISSAEVKARQLARLDPDEAHTLERLHTEALARGSVREKGDAAVSLAYAREHLFERVSVAKEYELLTEALRHGRGRIELSDLKAALSAEIATGTLLAARGEVASQHSLDRERSMVAAINAGVKQFEPIGRGHPFVPSANLREEQRGAVQAVLESRDLAVNLRGAAGTGKTFTLEELHRGLTEARQNVMAVAPTTSAVEELQKASFPQAITISRLLADPQKRHEAAGHVLLVDEAGMVASKDMAELLRLAQKSGARLVYSGDTRQIKSVTEGDALRILERESKLKTVSLLQVQRQTNPAYKAAVETLRNHPTEGFRKLEAMGAVHEVDWRIKAREVSRIYRQQSDLPNDHGKVRSVLVIAPTHEEIRSVTHAIRQDRKQCGEIAEGQLFVQHTPLNWTHAQKQRAKNYQSGLVLEFHKNSRGVRKNEALEVLSADPTGITATSKDGQQIKLSYQQAKAFSVFEPESIEVSPGDKLLLQANRREPGFRAINGQLATVSSIASGVIQLQDGRRLPSDYHQFSHGYAVTAHRSQGKTVDFPIISADRMQRDLAYVSFTRGREGLAIITSDKESLKESIGVSSDRQSASELARAAEDFRLHQAHTAIAQHVPTPAARTQEVSLTAGHQAQRHIYPVRVAIPQKELTHEHAIDSGHSIGF